MGMFNDLLTHLDRPSNSLQGLVNEGFEGALKGFLQEEDYNFKDSFSEEFVRDKPQTAAVLGTVADFVVDPLNLIGVGLFAKGAKVAKAAVGAGADASSKAMRGLYPSSVPNYIPGHYGPTDAAKIKAGALKERMRKEGASRGEINLALKKLYTQDKAGGFARTAVEGTKNAVVNAISPEARALYRSTGINKPLYQTGQLSNKRLNTELVHRAFANRHIGTQAGRQGDTKVIDELMSKGFHTDFIPMSSGAYGKNAKEFPRGQYGKDVTNDEFSFIEKHFSNVWKDKKNVPIGESSNPFFILKKPQSVVTGDHWSDMISAPQINALATSFALGKKIPKDPKGLKKYLENDGFTGLTTDKDGVWLEFSKAGSSITEGGVNFLIKIKPNGRLAAVMSDEHNFLEFIPGVSKALPNRVVAVTPPMTGNIRTMRPLQSGSKRKNKPKPNLPNQHIPKAIKDLLDASPTEANLAFERGKALQKLGVGLPLGYGLLTKD